MALSTRRWPGDQAQSPAQIPPRGWWDVVKRAFKESSADNVSVLAGGVAFFAFLALFPALIAALTLYGLLADPAQVAQQIDGLASALPPPTRELLSGQLTALTENSSGALTTGLIISLLAALWSASSGTNSLIAAINVAYDERETRGFLKQRLTALVLTMGAVVFVLVAVALIAGVPVLLDYLGLDTLGRLVAQAGRWVLLVVMFLFGLAVLYRVAPDREAPQFRWVSPGSVVATFLWLLGSVAFSLYVNFFGNYGATYGALTGVIVLMLWLYLTSFIVLLGAEINAEAERQTVKDSTTGEPLPMGRRGAVAADTVARSE
ncbi:MAG TPA: YihY/virulence factor BrkB family protein [Pseudonocardiaceae bacterium]|nr:YihY/virulence factor BrkB family protein [Pseudonocardiaceae bacterium]